MGDNKNSLSIQNIHDSKFFLVISSLIFPTDHVYIFTAL